METIREQILKALALRLAPLANGDVLRCQAAVDDFPAVSLWDIDEGAQRAQFGITDANVDLVVEYIKHTDDEPPSPIANSMIGDLIKAVIGTDASLGGLANSITYSGSAVDYPEAGDDLIAVRFAFQVSYQFTAGDPFTKP